MNANNDTPITGFAATSGANPTYLTIVQSQNATGGMGIAGYADNAAVTSEPAYIGIDPVNDAYTHGGVAPQFSPRNS